MLYIIEYNIYQWSSTGGDFTPQGTFDKVVDTKGDVCYWYVAG